MTRLRPLRRQADALCEWTCQEPLELGSIWYPLLGVILLAAALGFNVWIALAKGTPGNSRGFLIGCVLFISPLALYGWVTAARSSLRVDSTGISVTNPLNHATIPWTSVRRVEGSGTALRIWTDKGWAIRVFAVERANIERAGESQTDRIAAELSHLAERLKSTNAESMPLAKRWGFPLVHLIGWAVCVAVLCGYQLMP